MSDNDTNLFSVTEVELIYRNKVNIKDRPKIKSSQDAFDLLIRTWDMNKIELLEQFKVILLDRRNACLGISLIATGGMTACVVDPKVLFATALKAKATGLLLAHNHPSGNTIASASDKALTEKLCSAGKLLELSVIDHLIVTPNAYYSMADEGLMPL